VLFDGGGREHLQPVKNESGANSGGLVCVCGVTRCTAVFLPNVQERGTLLTTHVKLTSPKRLH
jgi:hypothetical protein